VRQYRVVGVGTPTIDHIMRASQFPARNGSVDVELLGAFGGGRVATALVTASRLGHHASLVAEVGDDDNGEMILAGLAEERVDVSLVDRRPGAHSAQSFVVIDGTGNRTILYDGGDIVPTHLSARAKEELRTADGVLVEQGGMSLTATRAACEGKALVVCDIDALDAEAKELAGLARVVVASEEVVERGEATDPFTVVDVLLGYGCEVAVVTLGAKGAVGGQGSVRHREAALPVAVVDATGAGDVYRGAFCVACLEGSPLVSAMRFAAKIAGRKCLAYGGRAGIPNRSDLDRDSPVAGDH
jgi:sulfofructose kinase